MNTETLRADIPASLAQAAFHGVSFTPERRAESARNDYAETLASDYAGLVEIAKGQPEKLAVIEVEFSRYRSGYGERYRKYLASNARCVSWMIAGPSNFPIRQMEKRNNVAHKRLTELLEYRTRTLAAIKKAMFPELAPIMASDPDACSRLGEKLAKAESELAAMKAVNLAHRKFKKDPGSLDGEPFSDAVKAKIRSYVPSYSWEPHPFAPFELTNLGANIRRMKERLAGLARDKATPTVEAESVSGNGIRMEDNPADNRVRLFFPGKPDTDARQRLKSFGFRWSPTLGCWQAYRNNHSLEVAKGML